MKLLGVIWNSTEDKWKDVLQYIKEYGKIENVYAIDFGEDFKHFVQELYPYSPDELWKSEYKIMSLYNQYKDNIVRIVVMDVPRVEKVFLPQKNKYIYKNVLDMKVQIRRKYKHLLKPNPREKEKEVKYDNVFHMTDDEIEYDDNIASILPFLIKYSNENAPFTLDSFVNKHDIIEEKNGTRKAYWITPSVMFKEQTMGTYESYSELFNMHLMKKLSLYNSCYYGLAQLDGKQGVITKHLSKPNEDIFLGKDIFNDYGIYEKKDLIYYNSLDMLPIIIKKFCYDNRYIYNDDIATEFEKLFMYDLLTMQSDRNPSNWALVGNKQTRQIRLSYFDHSNMLFFDDAKAVELFSKGQLDLPKYINNDITTFLIYDSSNIEMCHSSKFFHIQHFLKNATDIQKNMFIDMFNTIDIDLINEVIEEVEQENNCTLPSEFKDALIQGFNFHKWQINNIIEQINNNNKGRILCKKN